MNIRKKLLKTTDKAGSLGDLADEILRTLREIKKGSGEERIGYVAGVVTSDGVGKIAENVARLKKLTDKIRKEQDFPIFSSTDIFNDETHPKFVKRTWTLKERGDHFETFWRKILKNGIVTDVFMTPGWERSRGAKDEENTAKTSGLTLHYLEAESLN